MTIFESESNNRKRIKKVTLDEQEMTHRITLLLPRIISKYTKKKKKRKKE